MAEDWSAEHQGGCVIVWAFGEDCNLASTGFKWRKLYNQTRPSILLCTAVLDGVCSGCVKKKVFRCFFKGFFFNAWHLLFISAFPLFATGKPNSNVKRAAALRPTQVLRRIKLLLQRLSWHRMNYDTRVSTHIISSRGGGGATVNINASVWHPFLLVIMSIQQNT